MLAREYVLLLLRTLILILCIINIITYSKTLNLTTHNILLLLANGNTHNDNEIETRLDRGATRLHSALHRLTT